MERIARAQQGDAQALDELVLENVALVKSLLKRYLMRAEYDDLYQQGCMGLVKAVQHFDISLGVRFSTYAVPMVLGEIRRFLRDDSQMRVSRSLKDVATRAHAASQALLDGLGRQPTVQELAAYIEVSCEELTMALSATQPLRSLDEPVAEGDGELRLGDTLGHNPQAGTDDRLLLKQLIAELSGRDRQIIWMRYFQDKTQSEIASRLGISQVQVSRLESRILREMRERAG